LHGGGVYLRAPQLSDWAQWARLRAESRDFLVPWEPTWSADALTRAAFRRRLRRYYRDAREETGYAFFIFLQSDEALLGGITLTNVRRGVAGSCSVGYWIGKRHAHQGHMSDALVSLYPFVFGGLRLHRLEAACLPTNAASKGLLLKSGFSEEGFARQYLKINGGWRDHILFALLDTDDRPGPMPAAAVTPRPAAGKGAR
jgi:ribosomal-protein-alanine N-acetyltransferase